jgi:hypothetical protein
VLISATPTTHSDRDDTDVRAEGKVSDVLTNVRVSYFSVARADVLIMHDIMRIYWYFLL